MNDSIGILLDEGGTIPPTRFNGPPVGTSVRTQKKRQSKHLPHRLTPWNPCLRHTSALRT